MCLRLGLCPTPMVFRGTFEDFSFNLKESGLINNYLSRPFASPEEDNEGCFNRKGTVIFHLQHLGYLINLRKLCQNQFKGQKFQV